MSELPTECQQLLISGYVLGDLSSAEALLFEEMLSADPKLKEEVMAMQQALDLAYAPPEIAPPSGLRDRILATADARKTTDASSTASIRPNLDVDTPSAASTPDNTESISQRSKIIGILGAIALAIGAILGIASYRLWQTSRNTPDLQTAENTYVLRGEDLPPTTTVELVTNDDSTATLTANNLPPLPPDKAYALWTVVGKDVPYTTDQKGAILSAVFQVDESGNFTREIAVPQPYLEPRTIQKIAVTVEDVSAPQAHTGSILLSTGDELQSRLYWLNR